MIAFDVNDMTCGHCVSAITRAVRTVDTRAMISIDLAARRVEIESAETSAPQLADAIRQAGYTPIPAPARSQAVATAKPAGTCCCA